jgi:pimeloyl-ACP methyl ester carboxylesterase
VCEGFTLEYVDVGDVTLRVRHRGDGQPVVLLHGHPRTHTTWHRTAPQLAGSFFVACPDLRANDLRNTLGGICAELRHQVRRQVRSAGANRPCRGGRTVLLMVEPATVIPTGND